MFVYINPSNFYKAFQEYYEYAPTERIDLFLFFYIYSDHFIYILYFIC